MKITAVYFVQESSPYQMYVLDVCNSAAEQFTKNSKFKSILWSIFEEEREKQGYPLPTSDVVFLYTEDFRSTNIAAQMLDEDDD